MKKEVGILMPISSLPSNYGIGTLGVEAYKFIDFLAEKKQSYWQVLPIGPTSYGDSPYASFSTFAGNPYFIDLDILIEENLIKKTDIDNIDFGTNPKKIDYGKLYENRFKVLKVAFQNRNKKLKNKVEEFKKENFWWLEDYSFFMALKDFHKGIGWNKWPKTIRLRGKKALKDYRIALAEEIEFWNFIQYLFYYQWKAVKNYANINGIKIIGDLPIYCAYDSAEVWANKKNFKLDTNGKMITVAGCPPDDFSENGQLWGNPIYNWDYIKSTNYKYWVDRIKGVKDLYDIIRIDHFRGFEAFWEVDSKEKTAVDGKWVKGPGMELFTVLKRKFKSLEIIAEDLGYLTKEVEELLEETGFPGMNVLQFAFDGDLSNKYLPQNQKVNSVVYTGTHDNNTTLGWAKNEISKEVQDEIRKLSELPEEASINEVMIDIAYNSPAKIAIIPIQDILSIGEEGRINKPSTIGGNWIWRLRKDYLNKI